MTQRLKAQDIINAIPGTGGVVAVLARKLGCDWKTANKYTTEYQTIREAWEAERQSTLDLAESVILQNIKLAQRAQQPTRDPDTGLDVYPAPVDTSDAKWMLSKRGKDRGYGEQVEVKVNATDIDAEIERELARLATGRKGRHADQAAHDPATDA